MAFARVKASTTARGYGRQHQNERAHRLTYITPAHSCGWCKQPLGPEFGGYDRRGRRISRWALPHNVTRTGYLPGMWHEWCNKSEAGKRANAMQRSSSLRW